MASSTVNGTVPDSCISTTETGAAHRLLLRPPPERFLPHTPAVGILPRAFGGIAQMTELTVAIGNHALTKPLKDGRVRIGDYAANFVQVDPIIAAMRRMVRSLEFDVCEMAFTTYLCAVALGQPIVAIPVFVTRNFHHWAIFKNVKAGIASPKDLEGKLVSVNRGYTVTTGLQP